MKRIILVFLVFISTFLKGQSVDPETFPTVSGAIGGKYLYTNTGGEGKVMVKTILDSVPILDTISVDYATFYALITGGNLQVGRTYILMDFQTIYDQMDFDNLGNLKGTLTTKTGAVEEIWLYALANDRIADKAYSKTFPNDEIQYDWTYNATFVNGSPAKGRISERIDEWNNRTDYDHRVIKFIRYDDGAGNFTVINDNGNASQEFLTFGNSYATNTGEIIVNNYLGDFYSIGQFIGQEYSNNVFLSGVVLDNISGSIFYNNTFSGEVNRNTFSGEVYANTFSGDVNSNTFSGDVNTNTFSGAVNNNTFSGSVNTNTFSGEVYANTFSGDVNTNTFSGAVNNNTFSGSVNTNTFSGVVTTNTFSGDVNNNTFSGDVTTNTFSGDVNNNTFSGVVTTNTFSGDVNNNTFSGVVTTNAFSGSVNNNTFSGSVNNNTFSIDVSNNTFDGGVNSNTFNGDISYNIFTHTSPLIYTTLNGYIGSRTIDQTTYPLLFGGNYEKSYLEHKTATFILDTLTEQTM